jgi:hypothetical protein
MKDIHSGMTVLDIFGPVALSADNTPATLDRRGYEGVELVLGVGIGGITFDATNKIEFTLTHSDDDTTYTNVTDADMLGVTGISGGIIKSLVAAHAAAAHYRYGYKGSKRYLKLLANFSGTHGAATPLDAHLVLSWGHDSPQAAQA